MLVDSHTPLAPPTPAKSQDVKEEFLIFRIKNYFLIKCTRFALVEI